MTKRTENGGENLDCMLLGNKVYIFISLPQQVKELEIWRDEEKFIIVLPPKKKGK